MLQPLGWDLLRTHLGPEDRATLALVEAYETLQTGAAWTGLQAQLQAEGGDKLNTSLPLHHSSGQQHHALLLLPRNTSILSLGDAGFEGRR